MAGPEQIVGLGCLGFHVWPYLAADPSFTDELRLDLDPQPGTDFTHIRAAAKELHAILDELYVMGYPKTTGNRGLHVYVRLERRWDCYQVRSAAVAIARELVRPRASRRTGVDPTPLGGDRSDPPRRADHSHASRPPSHH